MSEDKARRRAEERVAPRRSGCLGVVFGTLLAPVLGPIRLVITLALIAAVIILTLAVSDFLRDPLDGFLGGIFGFGDSDPQEVDSRTIVLGIREMAILETIKGAIQIDKTVVDRGASPDAEIRVQYVSEVRAGIDLSLVTDENIEVNEDGSVTIILPPAHITLCNLGKPDVVSRKCTDIPAIQDCGKIVDGLLDVAYDRGIVELHETAYELDLLSQAYSEAERRVYDLLSSLGHDQVTFQRSNQRVPDDASCFPDGAVPAISTPPPGADAANPGS